MSLSDNIGSIETDRVQDSFSMVRLLLAPLPLFLLQPILNRVVKNITKNRPELFNRIGEHKTKCFLIDPINLPFAFLLQPNPEHPGLKAVKRHRLIKYNARIAASFLTLLDLVDGRLDGDALFFARELIVEGDTEAVVCLRNAIDDLEGTIASDIAAMFGSPGSTALKVLRRMREYSHD